MFEVNDLSRCATNVGVGLSNEEISIALEELKDNEAEGIDEVSSELLNCQEERPRDLEPEATAERQLGQGCSVHWPPSV